MQALEKILKSPPKYGSIVTSKDGEPVPVYVDTYADNRDKPGSGATRVMFVNIAVDLEHTGWYLTSASRGLKGLVLPLAQKWLIDSNKGSHVGLEVTSLRVVRHNKAKTALLCEVVGGL